MSQIKRLTPERLALVLVYRQKWRDRSADPIDAAARSKVRSAIPVLYGITGLAVPRLEFFGGPSTFSRALKSSQITSDFNALERLERRIRDDIVPWGIGLLCLALFLLWFWSIGLLITQYWTNYFWTAVFLTIWLNNLDTSNLFGQIRFLLLAVVLAIAPLLCVWSVRDNTLLMWELGSLPVALILLAYLSSILGQRLLHARWQKNINASIDRQLTNHMRSELKRLWAIARPSPQTSSGTNLTGHFSSLKSSYEQFFKPQSDVFNTVDWIDWCSKIDFCVSVLDCEIDQSVWEAIQTIVQDCGLIWPMPRSCWVCDRPIRIGLDAQGQLHGEGEAAIGFGDDSHVYAYHGVILPTKYGSLHPHQWQASWVLAETNAEVRRALIQGIGYGRLCQELNAATIDGWREYVLLKIDLPVRARVNNREVEEEVIHMLKMTCPSTQHIHVLRVPPHIRSARAAAQWVNWDVDPNQFSKET
jgi:hypothetical protein